MKTNKHENELKKNLNRAKLSKSHSKYTSLKFTRNSSAKIIHALKCLFQKKLEITSLNLRIINVMALSEECKNVHKNDVREFKT